MSNNDDLGGLGDMFKSMQVGKNVASHGFFGAMNREKAAQASLAAAVAAGDAAIAAGADKATAAAAAGAAGAMIFEPYTRRAAKKSAKRAKPRRTTLRQSANNLQVEKQLKNLERAFQADARRRRLMERTTGYKGRLSQTKGRQTLRNRLYSMAKAALTAKPKTARRPRAVKNVTMNNNV